jgi:4-hydroxy-3-polyprenylbenzoate decarboxylase
MPYNDLREFFDKLESMDDLAKIKEEVDWNLEAGAIMRRANESEAPCVLFENIKGYPRGYRLASGVLSTFKRLALTMEMNPDSTYNEILDEYMNRRKNPIKPIVVSDGPCKENIIKGDEVDLFRFPAPLVHGGDGGRYIGTLDIGICKDFDSDWVNYGTYRLMIHDKNSTGIAMLPSQHVGIIYTKYEGEGKPMPYVACIGVDPVISFIATTGVPYGVNEVDIIGGVRREPLRLIKCETLDLYVPATAELVLEGEMLPYERRDEGTFGEYSGYQVSERGPRPVFKVKCITHRNNPIITVSCIGVYRDDFLIAGLMGWAADFKEYLLELGIPITGIYIPPESGAQLCIVATKTPYPRIANRIASAIWGHKNGLFIPRVMVVNDDVDPTNMTQVIHAFVTKCHPKTGTIIFDKSPGCVVTPFIDQFIEERDEKGLMASGCNVLYDCTWTLNRGKIPVRSAFEDIYPQEIKSRVLNKWEKYGFK